MIIRCPLCGVYANIIVTETRELPDGFGVRRRRECMMCKQRFTTYERMKNGTPRVDSGKENEKKQ